MGTPKEKYYENKAKTLIKHLTNRHFDAFYCPTKEEALNKALELIPEGSVVGWGGSKTADQIHLKDAIRKGNYRVIDRENAANAEEKTACEHACFQADVFITGANALSMDGEMVNIDGIGNRTAAIVYGPRKVIVLVGMNKVERDLESAVSRARNTAAPANKQRIGPGTPCYETGVCVNCHLEGCICNQIVITRNCRPAGRIQFILIGEDLGF